MTVIVNATVSAPTTTFGIHLVNHPMEYAATPSTATPRSASASFVVGVHQDDGIVS